MILLLCYYLPNSASKTMARERILRQIPETVRTSKGAAIGERRRLAEARKIDPQTERIIRFTLPNRASILDTVGTRTRTHPELNDLLQDEAHLRTLTEFIDARILAANGDRTLIEQFIKRADPRSKTYDSKFAIQVDSLNTHFHIVLSCFPQRRK